MTARSIQSMQVSLTSSCTKANIFNDNSFLVQNQHVLQTFTLQISFEKNSGHVRVDLRQFIGKAFMLRPFSAGQLFLHQRKNEVWADKFDGTPAFMKLASFVVVKGLSGQGVSFR